MKEQDRLLCVECVWCTRKTEKSAKYICELVPQREVSQKTRQPIWCHKLQVQQMEDMLFR